MAAIARLLARQVIDVPTETLTKITFFCAAGLLLSLLMMTYGIELNPGSF
jgi:hypothetical protein